MRYANFAALASAPAAVLGAVLASARPEPLEAQVIRCYDVVCTVDANGVVRCVERPTPCPPDVT